MQLQWKRLVMLSMICIFLMEPSFAFAKRNLNMLITVSVSPNSRMSTTISVAVNNRLAQRIISCPSQVTLQKPEMPRATITIHKNNYVYDALGQLFDTSENAIRMVRLSSALHAELESWVVQAEQALYGEYIPWHQVRTQFPRMSYAKVIDLETGESFRVQRRAGSRHADVQPLTKADTAIMKKIYNGAWSWRRRAILVELNGRHYAASMNGMPHGAGAISGNNFRGHFCIHFQGSATHKKKKPDPAHQLMILKAAGKLHQSLMNADAVQLIEYYMTALHEQDAALLKLAGDETVPPVPMEQLVSIRWQFPTRLEDHLLLHVEIPIQVNYIQKNVRSKKKAEWSFLLSRSSPFERWHISQVLAKP